MRRFLELTQTRKCDPQAHELRKSLSLCREGTKNAHGLQVVTHGAFLGKLRHGRICFSGNGIGAELENGCKSNAGLDSPSTAFLENESFFSFVLFFLFYRAISRRKNNVFPEEKPPELALQAKQQGSPEVLKSNKKGADDIQSQNSGRKT